MNPKMLGSIGFSPDLVVGVYTGFDEPRSLGKRETGSSVAVPIFKDFMESALADVPLTPFRIPPGIRHVQVNAKTGARANPGDEKVIWEAFVTGTEPTDDLYILDQDGINLMPVGGLEMYTGANGFGVNSYETGLGNGYDGVYNQEGGAVNQDGIYQPLPGPSDATSGTGGLY